MIDDAYMWGMALTMVNHKLEGVICGSLKRGKKRVRKTKGLQEKKESKKKNE